VVYIAVHVPIDEHGHSDLEEIRHG
jgi:hypothetical protein